MGIDRDQLNETFWSGVGSPGSVAPDPSVPQSPGEEWRTKWATLDVEQANQLLDEIGLTEKDGEGFRMRSDGSGRLRLEVFAIALSCPSPASPSRSPSSGRRSASSSTSRSWSATWV